MLALRCVDQREPISSSRPRFVDIVAELRHIVRQAEQVQGGATMSTPPSAAHRPSSTRSPTPVAVDAQQPEVSPQGSCRIAQMTPLGRPVFQGRLNSSVAHDLRLAVVTVFTGSGSPKIRAWWSIAVKPLATGELATHSTGEFFTKTEQTREGNELLVRDLRVTAVAMTIDAASVVKQNRSLVDESSRFNLGLVLLVHPEALFTYLHVLCWRSVPPQRQAVVLRFATLKFRDISYLAEVLRKRRRAGEDRASSTPVQQHNRVSPASSSQHGDGGESGVRVIRSVHPQQSASDKSVNDSVSYHRMEHVTIRPRQSPAAQTRAPVGIPDHSLENSAFQFNHMITGYDRSSIQNQTIQ
ncbi:hypothetical protein FOZ62_001757, partial [Perkinsus olseni]